MPDDKYYHFSFKVARRDNQNLFPIEYAWVTMKWLPFELVHPGFEARFNRIYTDWLLSHPGAQGVDESATVRWAELGFVQGAAYRASHRSQQDIPCPSEEGISDPISWGLEIVSWEESDSESVFCTAFTRCIGPNQGLNEPPACPEPEIFSILFSTYIPTLLEDGTRVSPLAVDYTPPVAPIDPIYDDGRLIEMRGDFTWHPINYANELEYHVHCGESWVQQYLSLFGVGFPSTSPLGGFGCAGLPVLNVGERESGVKMWDWSTLVYTYTYTVSTSRAHPDWLQYGDD